MGFEICLPKGVICAALVGTALWGCGGSSSAPPHGVESQAVADFTAVVNVNVATGLVTFTPSSAVSKTSRTVFTGPTMSMSSSVLLNQAGSPGVKTTSVVLTNNSTLPIGIDVNGNVTGLRVLFGAFTITGGSSSDPVELSNPTGTFPTGIGGIVPYIGYLAQIAPNKGSPAQNWDFIVPSGVTAFSVPVTIEADNSYPAPPNGASNVGSSNVYVRTLAGGATLSFANGTGTQARFYTLGRPAIDRSGNLYLPDIGNQCIRRVTPAGVVSTIAGSPYLFGSLANGLGNVAQFRNPQGVAVTPDGSTIYVADSLNNAIRRIALIGTDPTNAGDWNVTTIAGTGAVGGNYFTATKGSSATLNSPQGIAIDQVGNLTFTEGNRVRKLTFLGSDPANGANWEVTLLGGDASSAAGVTGDADGETGLSTFNAPAGVAVDLSGYYYVADSGNSRIRKITPDGVSSTLAGGTSGSAVKLGYVDGIGASAQFTEPLGVAVDSSGLVYVADTFGYRIREVTQAGNVTTIAGIGGSGIVDGPGNTAAFDGPSGIAVSSSGTLYVGDYGVVRLVERISSQ